MFGLFYCALVVLVDRVVLMSHIHGNMHYIKDSVLEKGRRNYILTQIALLVSAIITAYLFWLVESQVKYYAYFGVTVYVVARFIFHTHYFQSSATAVRKKYVGMAIAPTNLTAIFIAEAVINMFLLFVLI